MITLERFKKESASSYEGYVYSLFDAEYSKRQRIQINEKELTIVYRNDSIYYDGLTVGMFYNNKMIGHSVVDLKNEKGVCKLYVFCIDSRYRGNGLGMILMRDIINMARKQKCKKIFLHSRDEKSTKFYLKMNFTPLSNGYMQLVLE